jgi:hypothetical protein
MRVVSTRIGQQMRWWESLASTCSLLGSLAWPALPVDSGGLTLDRVLSELIYDMQYIAIINWRDCFQSATAAKVQSRLPPLES